MGNCFENTPHENLDFCPNEEVNGGLSTRLHYIPVAFLESFTGPLATATKLEERLKMPATGLVPKSGKGFKGIDILINENEVKSNLVGNTGNKKNKSELDIFIPGFREKALAFVDANKNTPMIFVVLDANGKKWVIGNKTNPAYIESADATTGKKNEDNSGVTCKITTNSKLLVYPGDIVETPDL
jgi:hypothetical protein